MSQKIEELINIVESLDKQIFDLNQTIADQVHHLAETKSKTQEKLNFEIAKAAFKELSGNEYGCGTANIETHQFKIKAVVSKNVKWDEKVLKDIKQQIIAAGQNPEVYIKEKLSVSETAYKGFPQSIKNVFLPARTVEPSAPKITYQRK
jgi:hypothetical protein